MGKRCNFDCSYCGADLHDNTSKHKALESFDYTIKTLRSEDKKKTNVLE